MTFFPPPATELQSKWILKGDDTVVFRYPVVLFHLLGHEGGHGNHIFTTNSVLAVVGGTMV
jgi:hypothetical protein